MEDARDDLPGYRRTQETEALGLVAVEAHLLRGGFKVTRVSGSFDDGLDLLVSQHDGLNVLPAIAGLQVRAGSSHSGIKVGRHERYWRDHNLPVFGVLLENPAPEDPRGGWCDARAYLRLHPGAKSIPAAHPFPDGLAEALQAACDQNHGTLSALDLFDEDWRRQATASAALAPLACDPRVAALLRTRLGKLGPRATHYALAVLLMGEAGGADTGVLPTSVAAAVDMLYECEVEGSLDLEAWHDGTEAAYRLLAARGVSPDDVLEAALSARGTESTVLLLAMAVSLAQDEGEDLLRRAVDRAPGLAESPDVAGLAHAIAEGGYTFAW